MRAPLIGLLLLQLAAVVVTACGTPKVAMQGMADHFGMHVTDLQTEFDKHNQQTAAAADVTTLVALEEPHRTKALETFKLIDEMFVLFPGCNNDAKASPDVTVSKEAMVKIKAAAEAHFSFMAGVAGLTEARTEEFRYHSQMRAEVAPMKTESDSLKANAAPYMCDAWGTDAGH